MGVLPSVTASNAAPVGFIGLGHMGGHMARNLLAAGHPLVVFDLSEAALQKITAQAKELNVKGQSLRHKRITPLKTACNIKRD